ncbi:hypothetical protein [Aquimarina mytili]|uniref:Polymer-forming cytoskeletal protein n=1 Tax=Aquimarina mytili TaxID=874423 RepID=A0A937D8I9_9FLAO|nr:hypothetical protein [Aquimarina mytili]MBL0682752.1 hypothetical protein [Aquimarina mytili]
MNTKDNAHKISIEEAKAIILEKHPEILTTNPFELDEASISTEEPKIQLYEGDVSFDQNFAVRSETILVNGSLKVDGLISDCNLADVTSLIVLGDVIAKHMHICGKMVVGGNIIVEEFIYLNSFNNYTFHVFGSLESKVLMEEGMRTWIRNEIEVDKAYSFQNSIRQGVDMAHFVERYNADPIDVFLEEFLDGEYIEKDKVLEAQSKGISVLK